MDFPLFYLDFIGNRLLIAIVAVVHVLVNHPLAVGAYPLVVAMEWWAWRRNDLHLDQLVYRYTFVLFVVTTTVGALTGVGIWLTTALIAPFGIGSLLRIFFWAWFTEWLVFISEVVLVLIYVLTWKKWLAGGRKKLHLAVGTALAICSWLTMAIIVAVLSFMMDSGDWALDQSFFSAFLNPVYLPQLAFRTTFAMIGAGLFAWFVFYFFTKRGTELRGRAVRFVSLWVLAWLPFWAASAIWYWNLVPQAMAANLGVGLLTQAAAQWLDTFLYIVAGVGAVIVLLAMIGAWRPRVIPQIVLLVPFVLGLYLFAHFERVREFVRKPHVVAEYMYSNGVTMNELPVLQRDGMLRYATFVGEHQVTDENKIEAGHDVYMIACSRCHTSNGVNGVVRKFENLYGPGPLDEQTAVAFLRTMHVTRTYMPPFPGNEAEMGALAVFVRQLQATGESVRGAQDIGVTAASAAGSASGGMQEAMMSSRNTHK